MNDKVGAIRCNLKVRLQKLAEDARWSSSNCIGLWCCWKNLTLTEWRKYAKSAFYISAVLGMLEPHVHCQWFCYLFIFLLCQWMIAWHWQCHCYLMQLWPDTFAHLSLCYNSINLVYYYCYSDISVVFGVECGRDTETGKSGFRQFEVFEMWTWQRIEKSAGWIKF